MEHVTSHGLEVAWILETHAHADHLTAAAYLQERLGGRLAIGEHIRDVQSRFGPLFDLGPEFVPDGSQSDQLFKDGDTLPSSVRTMCSSTTQ